ncbi:GGDEF domain-containing protein [Paractinoplanes rishiriensis]|uniref:GGDEF domain-containing protein n=1 Tax=Paractinoplanes rishiriensis TaxID=1050105 RepID=A0A919K313_9ACTN|nr:GGDEF domain-containing protein [Actinoplanes rishiriensis]GIE97698.1 hypothetical protein Ari01nite_51630 [Actinoplanes rishiriensis]
MGRRGWLPVWPLVLLGLNSALLLAMSGSADYEARKWILGLVANVIGLSVTLWAAFQRGVPARQRRPWKFFAAYWMLLLASATFMMAAFRDPAHQDMTMMIPGAMLWVAAGIPTLLALLSFPVRRMSGSERIRFGLDMATVCGGGFIPLWFLVLAPVVGSDWDTRHAFTIAQPIEHLLLIFVASAVLLRAGITSVRHPLAIILSGQAVIAVGVVWVAYLMVQGGTMPGVPLDLVLQGGTYLLVLGMAVQVRNAGRTDAETVAGPNTRRPALVPYVALGLGYSCLVAAAFGREAGLWAGMIGGALVMTGAVAARQIFALRENHHFVVRDALTGLASRIFLHDMLHRAVERTKRTSRPTAVLLIDLNGFKPINDKYGHAAGDELLTAFGARLGSCVSTGDTVGRLGGDEFAVVLPDVTDAMSALRVADTIIATCVEPFTVADHEVLVGASIGVSINGDGEPLTGHELLRRADVAMYRAKQHSAGNAYLYDLSMDIDPDSVPEPTPMPGLSTDELAELDRLRSRIADLERKGLSAAGAMTESVSR